MATNPTERRAFRLKKDVPDAKKGAIFQQQTSGGNTFSCVTPGLLKHGAYGSSYSRLAIFDKQPTWFEEVYQTWLTQDELKKLGVK